MEARQPSAFDFDPDYNVRMESGLRDATLEDLETLWRIDQRCFPPGIAYSRRDLTAFMRLKRSFTLVEESQTGKPPQIQGFLIAAAQRNGVGHIITIDVIEEARRLGVGSKLLFAAEQRLVSDGCRLVSLETAVDNQFALKFYKRHKYFLVNTIPHYYSNGVDALVLQKDLLSAAQVG